MDQPEEDKPWWVPTVGQGVWLEGKDQVFTITKLKGNRQSGLMFEVIEEFGKKPITVFAHHTQPACLKLNK